MAPSKKTSDRASQLEYIEHRPKLQKLANKYSLEPLTKSEEAELLEAWGAQLEIEFKDDEEHNKDHCLHDKLRGDKKTNPTGPRSMTPSPRLAIRSSSTLFTDVFQRKGITARPSGSGAN